MKKSICLFLSVIMLLTSCFAISTEALADECAHEYKLSYSFDSENVRVIATPVCSKCHNEDATGVIILSDLSMKDDCFVIKVSNPSSPYVNQLPIPSQYLKDGTFTVPVDKMIDLIPEFGKLLSEDDRKALAQKLGVDEKVFTCKHSNIADIKNFEFVFDKDYKSGSVTITCPDCGLSFSFHFTVTAVDTKNGTVTIKIDEIGKSFTFNVAELLGELNTSDIQEYIKAAASLTGLSQTELSKMLPYGAGSKQNSQKKPKGTVFIKKKGLKKAVKLKWKKIKGVKGYQIKYSTSKKLPKNKKKTKTKTFKGAKKISCKIKKLKKKKTYYFKIRTYKVVNNKKVYSKWSKAVKVKTK